MIQHHVEDVVYVKNNETTEETISEEDGYTYHLVEEYEDEERIADDGDDYSEEKNVQIILKVERRDETDNDGAVEQYNIEMSEVEEQSSVNVDDQHVVQEEVYEYEIENDGSTQPAKGESEDELDVIPKMVFRKYNKRNKKMPAPPYICSVCSKVLSNYSSFKYHMQLHSDKKVRESERPYRNTSMIIHSLSFFINIFSLSYAAIVENLSKLETHTTDT